MKATWMVVGLSGMMAFATVQPVQAMNKEWAAVAGFVGGLLVANAGPCGPVYRTAPVYRDYSTQYYTSEPRVTVQYSTRARGHYQWQTEREWVPGCWTYEDMGCGRSRKVWQPGHYRTFRTKVWVASNSYCD